MRRRLVGVLAAVTLLAGAAAWAQGLPATTPEAVGLSTPRVGRLVSFMQDSVKQQEIAGAVVVIARGGKVAVDEPVGWMDVEKRVPMRKDTIFRMASMTKAVTSVAAVMLMEEGKLRLADPVSRFIPAFKATTVVAPGPAGTGRYGAVPAKREITNPRPADAHGRHLVTETGRPRPLTRAQGCLAGTCRTGRIRSAR